MQLDFDYLDSLGAFPVLTHLYLLSKQKYFSRLLSFLLHSLNAFMLFLSQCIYFNVVFSFIFSKDFAFDFL
jgi:hypothetical protein